MTSQLDREIDQLEYEQQDLERRIAELRRRRPPEPVRDYLFRDASGAPVAMSSLFEDKRSLTVIHNMGHKCSFCTMWADGFSGLYPHLRSRVAFVVTSTDAPDTQRAVAARRGWTFPMYSVDRTFVDEMGFVDPSGGMLPGVSTFEKTPDGSVVRTSRAEFGPGDRFCAVWHFFELSADGAGDWQPRFTYA